VQWRIGWSDNAGSAGEQLPSSEEEWMPQPQGCGGGGW